MPALPSFVPVVLAIVGAASSPTPGADAPCDRVLTQLRDANPEQIRALIDRGLDVWNEHARPGAPVEVYGSAAAIAAAREAGLELEPLPANVCRETATARGLAVPPAAGESFYDRFRPLSSLQDRLHLIATSAGTIARTVDIGTSVEGRPLEALVLGHTERATVLVTGTVHPREWISPMATLWIAEHVVERHLDDGLLDELTVVVVPVVNPDGYVYSIEVERLWRKNRGGSNGVDLNRNFGFGFGGPGADADPSSPFYHGAAAFSEPETAALRDLAESLPNLVAHLDVHAYGALVLYPWQGMTRPTADEALFSMLAGAMAEDANEIEASDYRPLQGGSWYPASGTSSDWFYGDLGVPSLTLELRPRVALDGPIGLEGFLLPAEQIEPASREATAAADVLLGWAREEHGTPPGEEGSTGASSGEGETGDSATPATGETSASTTDDAGSSSTTGPGEDESDDDGDDDDEDEDSGTSTAEADYGESGTGCGCTTDPAPFAGFWGLLLLLLRRTRMSAARE